MSSVLPRCSKAIWGIFSNKPESSMIMCKPTLFMSVVWLSPAPQVSSSRKPCVRMSHIDNNSAMPSASSRLLPCPHVGEHSLRLSIKSRVTVLHSSSILGNEGAKLILSSAGVRGGEGQETRPCGALKLIPEFLTRVASNEWQLLDDVLGEIGRCESNSVPVERSPPTPSRPLFQSVLLGPTGGAWYLESVVEVSVNSVSNSLLAASMFLCSRASSSPSHSRLMKEVTGSHAGISVGTRCGEN
mmetsp:Transcript_32853/g.27781  ORF Transcript_32853/g.27781 Transcript_32853/m.27781 type:complete len:243 (-) Transcript_32853:512-1240(-)